MKHIYLVRHGVTALNQKSIHQSPDEPLIELGKKQSRACALRLKKIGINQLISSPHVRARETAKIIGEELDLPLTLVESFKEFRRPDSIYGQSHYSLQSIKYIWGLYWHYADPKWNSENAENMFTVRNRIEDSKNVLMQSECASIAVVTHAIFMDMFLQLVCNERELTLLQFIRGLILAKKIKNTEIIHLTYDENVPLGLCQWQWVENIKPK